MGTAFPSTGYRIDGGAVYRPTGVITDGLSLWVWVRRSHQQAIGLTAAVYHATGVITDGLPLRNGYGVPHQQAIGL